MQQVVVLFTGITLRLPLRLGHFLKGESMNKKQNVLLFQFSMEYNIHWMMGPVPHRFGVKCGQGPNQRLVYYKVVNN